MLTSENVRNGFYSGYREFLAQHLEDHERGEFQEKPSYLQPITLNQHLQLQYMNLVEENKKLRAECKRLRHSFNSQEEVIEIHRLNKENEELRRYLKTIESLTQESKTT